MKRQHMVEYQVKENIKLCSIFILCILLLFSCSKKEVLKMDLKIKDEFNSFEDININNQHNRRKYEFSYNSKYLDEPFLGFLITPIGFIKMYNPSLSAFYIVDFYSPENCICKE